MSAFLCHDDHFRALAVFAAHRKPGNMIRVDPRYITGIADHPVITPADLKQGLNDLLDHERATIYATILRIENERSVNYLYNYTDIDMSRLIVSSSHWQRFSYLPRIALLKMADGLEYQSSECPDYHESIAYRLLDHTRRALIRELPGYDAAPWAYAGEPIPRTIAA